MLLLTRREGEALIIDEKIRLIVINVKGKQVKFGFISDKNIPIDREEIFQKKKNIKQEKLN
jgi:carbon storage regulator